MFLNTLGDRLREARLGKGLTLEKAAEQVGVRLNTIWCYEKGRFHPSAPVLKLCAQIYEKPVEWFFGEERGEPEGRLVRLNTEAPESATPSASTPSDTNPTLDEVLTRLYRIESAVSAMAVAERRIEYDADDIPAIRPVEVVELAAAAGVGAEVYDETVVGRLWFRRDWLQSNGLDPDQCNVISVRGESMEPTLPDGCSILVDRSQRRRRRREGRIFVMRTEDGLVVKRAGKDAEGQWQIASDNPRWKQAPWSDDTEIIGEVRWSAVTF